MLKSVLRTPPSITASPAVYVAPFCVALMIIPARVMNIVVIGLSRVYWNWWPSFPMQNGDTHNSWQIVDSLSRLEWSL